MRSIPALDGTRALAAFLVVVTHVGFQSGMTSTGVLGALVARGDIGVAVFFVLSGFLLTRSWIGPRPPGARAYGMTRAARILPAYWLALAGVIALGSGEPSTGAIATNVLVLQAYTLDFLPGFTQTWSLTTEVTFYLALPLLILPLRRARARWPWIWMLAGTGLLCTGIAAAQERTALGMSILGHLGWFAAGLALAVTERQLADGQMPDALARAVHLVRTDPATVVAALGALLLVAATPLAGPRDLMPAGPGTAVVKELLYLVFALGLTAVAIWGDPTRWPSRVLGSRAGRWLGSISYGVFLWHLLVLEGIARLVGIPLFGGHMLFLLISVLVVSVGLGWLSRVAVEDPLRRLAHKAGRGGGERGDARQLGRPVGQH
jgi:peptidoglycan/LPS O-acetylase OafA/YrhL